MNPMICMPPTACSTCAQLASEDYSEKKVPPSRQTPCCDRTICGPCQAQNSRFCDYCPFCQISSERSSLPQGLRDPPGYEEAQAESQKKERQRLEDMKKQRDSDADGSRDAEDEQPPKYDEIDTSNRQQGGATGGAGQDTIHYLRPGDTVTSISLAYHVPLQILRSHNNLYSDHLLSARHEILVPASHYQGPSLSAEPVESEEERQRKARLRRFMIRTKCADYGVSEIYLRDAKEDVDTAVQRWEDDEKWERENPMHKTGSSGSSKKSFGAGLTGQLS